MDPDRWPLPMKPLSAWEIIYIYSFFRLFSLIGSYKVLNIVLCAMQQVLVGYLFRVQLYVYVNIKLLFYLPPFPLVTISLFSMPVGLFLFVYKFICIFLDYKQYHMIFVFLCLIYFT